MIAENNNKIDPLCCCEYFDNNNERNHLVACCCNCIDFDLAVDRLVRCKSVGQKTRTNMLITFQDRLRIPWRGGAKQVSLDAIVPIIILPLCLFVASLNFICSLIVCLAMPIILGYTYYYLKKISPRTKFFFLWAFWSVVYLCILFESTVPLMELLPEENVILILLVVFSIYCFYKAKQRATLNHVVQSTNDEDNLPDITEEQTSLLINEDESNDDDDIQNQPNICSKCRKYMPPRTYHCQLCQACIVRRDHHSIWLDCCIGESNYRHFFFGCTIGFCALVFGSNLSLTSICHPFFIANVFGVPIFLPDDCSEVFDQFDVALCFVGSIYAILLAVCIMLVLIQQSYFITKGITGTEWRQGDTTNRRSFLHNWKVFICCYR